MPTASPGPLLYHAMHTTIASLDAIHRSWVPAKIVEFEVEMKANKGQSSPSEKYRTPSLGWLAFLIFTVGSVVALSSLVVMSQ